MSRFLPTTVFLLASTDSTWMSVVFAAEFAMAMAGLMIRHPHNPPGLPASKYIHQALHLAILLPFIPRRTIKQP